VNYQFVFEKDETVNLPFRYQTLNPDETRTPIDLTGKRLVIRFVARGIAEPMLVLDSDEGPNAHGAELEITDADDGRFVVIVTVEQIAEFSPCFGEWKLILYDAGQPNTLVEGKFSVK
jgi:hypothetical protein